MEELTLVYCGTKADLFKNNKTGFYEIWQDGRRCGEILTNEETAAIKTFKKLWSKKI